MSGERGNSLIAPRLFGRTFLKEEVMNTLCTVIFWLGETGEHKGGLLDIDPGLIVWTIVTFAILLFILGKFAWKPIIKTLQEREEKIKNSLDEAEKARREAEALIAQNNDLLARAEREANDIMRKAKEEAEKLKANYAAQTKIETDKLLENAKKEIETEKRAALMELRGEISDMVVTAAGKVIGASLDTDKHKKIVDDFIKDLPTNQN